MNTNKVLIDTELEISNPKSTKATQFSYQLFLDQRKWLWRKKMTQMGKANTIIKKILQAKITFEVQMELFFHAQLGMINGEMI